MIRSFLGVLVQFKKETDSSFFNPPFRDRSNSCILFVFLVFFVLLVLFLEEPILVGARIIINGQAFRLAGSLLHLRPFRHVVAELYCTASLSFL